MVLFFEVGFFFVFFFSYKYFELEPPAPGVLTIPVNDWTGLVDALNAGRGAIMATGNSET